MGRLRPVISLVTKLTKHRTEAMPDVMLPASFLALLSEFRPIFTAPSFHNFIVLCCGFLHAIGKHKVSSAIRAAHRCSTKHYSCFYRFFSRAQWSLDDLGLTRNRSGGECRPRLC